MYPSFYRIVAYNLTALAVVLALTPDTPQRRQDAQPADTAQNAQDTSGQSRPDHAKAAIAAERSRAQATDTETQPTRSR